MIIRTIVTALALFATPAAANAPQKSLRPVPRATTAPVTVATIPDPVAVAQAVEVLAVARLRPSVRPQSLQITAAATRPESLPFLFPDTSPRPWMRPQSIEQKAMAKRRLRRKGAVCGDVEIQGEVVGNVPGRIKACGIKDAVRIKAVSGVALSQQALMNCETAQALKTWVENGLKPAFRRRGPVVEMKVAAHYACRTRNNQPGARISEHGKGKAIDISAFTMKDGEVITVLKGWGQGTTLRPLRKAYKAACGPFGTTLGPSSDRFHRDHFHFDTASHRSGPYCR